MASKAQLLLSSVRVPATSDVTSLMASTNQVLLSLNTQLQQISSAFTLTKPTVSPDGTVGGITVGNIIMGPTNFIRGGTTGYNAGTGFWLGYDTSPTAGYKFFVGSASGNKMTWNGSTLAITGTITATSGTIGGWLIAPTTISAGGLYLNSAQNSIQSGQTNYATGDGYWLGNTAGTAKLSIGSTTNYFKWDGSNVLVQGGSGNNLVIIDTNGFTVGKAADRRVVMGTYGGNPASLNFFATTNPTTSRLGVYLNGGTTPAVSLAFPSGATVDMSANSADFAFTGSTPTYGSMTLTSAFGSPIFDLTGPTGTLGTGPYLSLSNTSTSTSMQLTSTTLLFSNDTNLYRSAANTLKTDDLFQPAAGIQASNGAVGTPSYSFSGDTNTGFYWRAADNVGITCGGSDVLVVRSTGVVCLQPLKLNNGFQADTGLTVAGYVTIQDSGGTTYKVMLAT